MQKKLDMDVWEKQLREATYHHQYRSSGRDNPSFSSSLLDAIYRSIDESNGGERVTDEELILYRETMKKKHASRKQDHRGGEVGEDHTADIRRRACMIERWMMEKKITGTDVRRKSTADFEMNSRNHHPDSILLNSSSSSSESSTCGGNFSSSESDSFYSAKSKSSSSTCYSMQKPKPIRTSISSSQLEHHQRNYAVSSSSSSSQKTKSNSETTGRFVKTKSKALKIYSDLKKVKQPISPGGRLASFLNSIFTNGNSKKAKVVSSPSSNQKEISSNCSSASSFSRSCLSKTPSSAGKLSSSNNGTKRSVRFYPVSVIVDEDCRPCGHKNLYENNEELQIHVMSENRRVAEAARELLKSYQKKKEEFIDDHMIDIYHEHDHDNVDIDVDVDDDDDDDAASYASSDLFELDNLSAIGIERYSEELPVYETTHLDTNRAIANGLIL